MYIPVVILLLLPVCFGQNLTWIFGYGSLISQPSRDSTFVTNLPWRPVRVTGIGRGWWAPGTVATGWSSIIGQDEQIAPTFLGAYFDHVSITNGVIFQINLSTNALAAFDARELGGAGYSRITVPIGSIAPVDGGSALNSTDTVYFYNVIQSLLSYPTQAAPIVTSYVDVIMTACLAIDSTYNPGLYNFTNDFVVTTQNWSIYWVNDRVLPRRPWVYSPSSATIDNILAANLLNSTLDAIEYDNPGSNTKKTDAAVALLQAMITELQANLTALQNTVTQLKAKSGCSQVQSFGIFLILMLIISL